MIKIKRGVDYSIFVKAGRRFYMYNDMGLNYP